MGVCFVSQCLQSVSGLRDHRPMDGCYWKPSLRFGLLSSIMLIESQESRFKTNTWLSVDWIFLKFQLTTWQRKAVSHGLNLIPIPSDPFALPFSGKSDPLRGPVFVPLEVDALLRGGKKHLFQGTIFFIAHLGMNMWKMCPHSCRIHGIGARTANGVVPGSDRPKIWIHSHARRVAAHRRRPPVHSFERRDVRHDHQEDHELTGPDWRFSHQTNRASFRKST